MVTHIKHAMTLDKVCAPGKDGKPKQDKQSKENRRSLWITARCNHCHEEEEGGSTQDVWNSLDEERPAVNE